ncbi:sensor histidine kinase [Nannocystis bainbridge]|uniref:histidine kinase n=1 Tax=Nannocystis bainbridge TaxID=2995303 RepID=A0ABT5E926_9BACT|nr:ATP-binding protein [Nannocystis bainbridge]MDC0722365.1 ATP-binding protein [Nannocystis bainbridge]
MAQRPLTWSRRLIAVLERGLPPALLEDHEMRRRALLIEGTAWLVILACALTVPVILATTTGIGRITSLAADLGTMLLTFVGPGLLRLRGTPAAAGHWITGCVFAGTLYAVSTTGAFASPYWILLAIVPFLAAQMAGRSAGHLWGAICLVGVVALFAVDRFTGVLPQFHDPDLTGSTTAIYGAMTILAVHGLSHLADLAKDEAIARAEAAAVQLEHADLEVERARILAQQAVAASTAKSAFMATMSHELRTPLNAVIGYAEMLVEDADAQGLPDMRDDLVKIVGASQHLLGLIDDVLDLSRVEATKLDLQREQFAAEDVAREVAEALQPLARTRGTALEVRPPAVPLITQLDRGRVRQVLVNLVGNALKFTARGRVTVYVRGEADGDAQFVVFAVEDTGIGIREGDHKRIFEPFTQVDSSPRRRYEGTGLGLSLCKHLVEMMGGTIGVRSQVGQGSVFTVRLPVAAPGRSAPAAPDAAC